ncbi:MAG: S-methyl-5-thioribose-1-phosphate isomerase, partial [Candidatus Binatota bacterium]
MAVKTIQWNNNRVVMLDQRLLPGREVYRTYRDYSQVAQAIRDMVIRGAPAIGVAAAMGVALGAL